jgi:hypothetical protein
LLVLVEYFIAGHTHKRLFAYPGTAGKPQGFKAGTAGKGPGANAPQGIGQIKGSQASAVKKSPVFYGSETVGYVYDFKDAAVKKSPVADNAYGVWEEYFPQHGTAGKGAVINGVYPGGKPYQPYHVPGKGPLPYAVYPKAFRDYHLCVSSPVFYQNPVFYLKIGKCLAKNGNTQKQEKNEGETLFHLLNPNIPKK